jgi:predicted RNA binding protein YcfA (HicA-like mRNA interferase family)
MPTSGKDLVKEFERAGWTKKSQSGSHVKLEKGGKIQIIPMHKELKKGTEHSIRKSLKEK